MSHNKCPISDVFLESIYVISLFLFCMVHKSCLCTKFWIWMSKVSHLNFSLNTHFFVKTISSAKSLLPCASFSLLSHQQCFLAHLITQCVTSFWFFLKYIFLSEPYLSLTPFSSCISSITVSLAMPSTTSTHHHKPHLSMAANPTTQQNNTSHGQATSPPCCPSAASHFPH